MSPIARPPAMLPFTPRADTQESRMPKIRPTARMPRPIDASTTPVGLAVASGGASLISFTDPSFPDRASVGPGGMAEVPGRGRFPTCIRVSGAHHRMWWRFSPGVARNSRPRDNWIRWERMPVIVGHPASIPRPIPFRLVPSGVATLLSWGYRPGPFQIVKRGQPDNAEVTSSILVSPTRSEALSGVIESDNVLRMSY